MTRTNKRATNQLLRDSGEIKQTATVTTTATTTKATLWYRHKTSSAERSGEKGVRLCSAVSLRGQNKVSLLLHGTPIRQTFSVYHYLDPEIF